MCRTALCVEQHWLRGIGEKLTRLPQLPKCYILVGKPAVNVSTKLAYENLDLQNMGAHPDIDGMISDIENGDLYTMVSRMGNVFEPGIIGQYPVIQEIKDLMESHGGFEGYDERKRPYCVWHF